jgi:hypothetical protein
MESINIAHGGLNNKVSEEAQNPHNEAICYMGVFFWLSIGYRELLFRIYV